jgi:hypothetical protein
MKNMENKNKQGNEKSQTFKPYNNNQHVRKNQTFNLYNNNQNVGKPQTFKPYNNNNSNVGNSIYFENNDCIYGYAEIQPTSFQDLNYSSTNEKRTLR